MIRKGYLLLAVLLALPAFAAKKKTFVYCAEGSPSSFNPQVATDGATFNASSKTIYDRLVHFTYGETSIEPGLAESWDISEDGLTYTFNLRKGVKYHKTKYFTPSREFNADDVLFSFNRMRLKENPFHAVGGGAYEYFEGMEMSKVIKDIKKLGPYKVQFVLNRPEAPFLANLAMDFASIISKEYGDKLLKSGRKEDIDVKPVGTGPFVFSRYAKDTLIRYKANTEYWQGKADIDNLVFAITPDASVRYQKLKAGECHLATYPAPADLDAMRANKDINLMEQAGLNVGYLAMNVDKKPFDNQLVRQAVNYALNKSSYIGAVYLGQAKVAKNPLPPTIWSYNKEVKDYDHNVAKAKELLKKAGFPNGFETELWTLPVSRPYNPNGKKMGEIMQADLAKVGIKVKLVSYDWPTYLAKSKNGEHQMLQLGWTGDNGDPDNFLGMLLSCAGVKGGSNRARWCNDDFDKLIVKAKRLSKKADREALYKKAQLIFKKEAPWVTLAHSTVFKALRKNVVGYKIDPFGGDIFYPVKLVDKTVASK